MYEHTKEAQGEAVAMAHSLLEEVGRKSLSELRPESYYHGSPKLDNN